MIEILLNNDIEFDVPESLLATVRAIAEDHGFREGEISLVIVDDPTMHQLNREHLQHDYPTDVLSFVLESDKPMLDGEVIVSCDTAEKVAPDYGWSVQHELLLYFIHGTLHLVGYDDHNDDDRAAMRAAETKYLSRGGIEPPDDHANREHAHPSAESEGSTA